MTQGSDQAEAGAGPTNSPSWPPSGGVANTTAASGGAAGAMTLGSILTVAGILLLFVFFAAGLVSLQCCFNTWDRDSRRRDDASARRRRRGPRGDATRGVHPDLLRSLPVTVYRRAASGDGKAKDDDAAQLDCAVCLAELEDGDEARFLPRCGHGFHADCVDMWLASHTTCPLCRLTVAKPDQDAPPVSLPLLHPVPHERANYARLPASVLLGAVSSSSSDHHQGGAVAMPADTAPSSRTTPSALVIDIPEVMTMVAVPTPTPRDTLKSPASARLRSSIRRLWSFGRQQGAAGPSSSSSCSCAGGASEEDDLEQGMRMPKGAAVAMHSVAPDGT